MSQNRIDSIDILRGLVIILMALDHVRDFFHFDAYFIDPTVMSQTNVWLFWTRFITHFCAPVFVLLAGTSAYLVGQKKGRSFLSKWLLKRGLWLIFLEATLIKFAWSFNFSYSSTVFQVIWVLGISMVFLAGFIHLPQKLNIAFALILIFFHNTLDGFTPENLILKDIWIIFHQFSFVQFGAFSIFFGYSIIPWVAVMVLGYEIGRLFMPEYHAQQRQYRLKLYGLSAILLFFILRVINLYGEPVLWQEQATFGMTVASFFNVSKYPPSLQFLLITLGPSLILLAYLEQWKNRFSNIMRTFGQVPMFFYIVHLYVIHAFAVVAVTLQGFEPSVMVIKLWITLQTELQGYGFNLGWVYLFWLLLCAGLYPLMRWYHSYKFNNRDKWWLAYL